MHPMIYRLALVLVLLGAGHARGIVVEVAAGPHDRIGTPVVLALPEGLARAEAFTLRRLNDGEAVEAQKLPGPVPSVVWIERDRLPAGTTRRYRLEAAASPGSGGVSVGLFRGQMRVKLGGKPVLDYHARFVDSPAGIDALYGKSGHIHPLATLGGVEVTDDFPPDHAHQHGIFFAWVNTTFQGRRVDFWNQFERTGRVAHQAVDSVESGRVFGQFVARLRHEDLKAPGGPAPVLDETWTVRVYELDSHVLVDLESRQTCAGDIPLKVNAYHYGGFGLRGNRAWFDAAAKGNDPPDPARSGESDFLTSEGKGRRDGNHTRPRWVDLSGRVGGRVAGVAVLDHPGNFRFPQPIRLHPNKPYFCFAPMVLGEFDIVPGRPYISRYRLLAHDGRADARAIERAWRDYAEPPSVAVVAAASR